MKKIMRSPVVLFFIIVAVIAAGIAIYWQFYMAAPQQYRSQSVEKGDISQTVSANGTINPVTLVNVGTQVSGTVKKLYVDFNSKVEKGQILLELDDALLAAQLKQSEANVQNAKASLELATANEERTSNLFAQDYVSRQELDSCGAGQKIRRSAIEIGSSNSGKGPRQSRLLGDPFAGIRHGGGREVDVGQTVAASLQTPTLFKIAQDLSKMQIDSNFAEADIGGIRVGQAVRFTVDAFRGTPL